MGERRRKQMAGNQGNIDRARREFLEKAEEKAKDLHKEYVKGDQDADGALTAAAFDEAKAAFLADL